MNGMNNKVKVCIVATIMLFVTQIVYAQFDKHVGQYCTKVVKHPYQCHSTFDLRPILFGGLMLSNTSGDVAVNNTIWGIDVGLKLTNSWSMSCSSFQFLLNGYIDAKIATEITTDDDTQDKEYPIAYGGQITIAPGVRYGHVSFDCGPYIAYSAYSLVDEEDTSSIFDAETSGLDFGLRTGVTVHLSKTEIGLHYDMGLSDQSNKLKKNDIILSIGHRF